MAKEWTEDEKNILIQLYDQGETVDTIGDYLNRSSNSIRAMKSKLGLNYLGAKPVTEEEKQVIIDYYNAHVGEYLDLNYLAKKLERSLITISRVAKDAGLTNGKRKPNEVFIEKVRNSIKLYHESDKFQNEVRLKLSQTTSEYWKENGHPKGMPGKHHSDDARKRMSESHYKLASEMSYDEKHAIAMKAVETRIKNGGYTTTENSYSRCKGGKREDLNQYFRSSWEANIARVFNFLNISWKYEYKRFFFSENINGVMSYQPDFYLPDYDLWIEIKGWMDQKSKLRLQLFAEQYPLEFSRLIIIKDELYLRIQRTYGWIDNWESNKKHSIDNYTFNKDFCMNSNYLFQIMGYDKDNPRQEIIIKTIE